jgi:hypothetical protein
MSLLEQVSDVLFGPRRGLGTLIPNVVIEESHEDHLVITDHPVEIGSPISDHAYMRPRELNLEYGWSPGASALGGLLGNAVPSALSSFAGTVIPLSAGAVSGFKQIFNGGEDYLTGVYRKLRDLQTTRMPFDIVTGKCRYKNMLLTRISFTTSRETEYSLIVKIHCREVILVSVQTSTITESGSQTIPQQTSPVTNNGTVSPTPVPAPDQSILYRLGGGLFGS